MYEIVCVGVYVCLRVFTIVVFVRCSRLYIIVYVVCFCPCSVYCGFAGLMLVVCCVCVCFMCAVVCNVCICVYVVCCCYRMC